MIKLFKKSSILILSIIVCSGCHYRRLTHTEPPSPSPIETASPVNSPTPKITPEETPIPPTPIPTPSPELQTPEPATPSPETPTPTPTNKEPELSEEKKEWYYIKKSNHTTPSIDSETVPWLSKYDAYYVNNTSEKVLYLTFDEGYENGYTGTILDILKKQDVKATFFVTKSYITGNEELVKRMIDEGHAVGNHTITHRAMYDLSSDEIKTELNGVSTEFRKITGEDMPLYMRPPMGSYSEKSLYVTKSFGYKTIFWSMAYKDWDTTAQPTRETTMSFIESGHHNGAIILLHAVSKTNTECLEDIIKYLKTQGYSFKTITDIK